MWDGSNWTELGGGLIYDPSGTGSGATAGYVNALHVADLGAGDELFVGGSFTEAGGVSVSNVARWDGAQWAALGGGTPGHVVALQRFDHGGARHLYAAAWVGSSHGLARWDGSTWSELGAGLGAAGHASVHALHSGFDASGSVLVAGGLFVSAGSQASANVASWGCDVAPETYCTAKTNSLGCTPQIAVSGIASATLGSGFAVRASEVLNQRTGMLFYGLGGPAAALFKGGWLCVGAPLQLTPVQSSGGSSSGVSCTGVHAYDFNVRIASGVDPSLVAGQLVHTQWYTRDPSASFSIGLTDAPAFLIRD